MELPAGTIIEQRYRIEEQLGEGGMAVVYKARHLQLGTLHAIKVLTMSSKSVKERLLQEGRVQAALNHRNVLAVTDVVDVQGQPGLVMEYIAARLRQSTHQETGTLAVQQLMFQRVDLSGNPIGDPMLVEYAPAEISFSKAVQFAEVAIPGLEQPLIQFVRGDAETLNLELFFDSTQDGTGGQAVAVTTRVEEFHKLVRIQGDLHTPPLVRVSWGDDFPGTAMGATETAGETFTAVVLSVARRFTLFSPDGKPLRATVTLALKHYATVAEQVAAINYQSADHTRLHVVTEGETLPLIAHDAYSDSRKWRVIAEHNGLSEVRDLVPGTRLEIPPLVTR